MPMPSCQTILIRSPLTPLKTYRIAGVRIAAQYLLHPQCQPVHALPHVGPANRQPYPHAAWNGDHRRASTSSTRSSAAASISRSTQTRPPLSSSISISPGFLRRRRRGASATAAGLASETAAGNAGDLDRHERRQFAGARHADNAELGQPAPLVYLGRQQSVPTRDLRHIRSQRRCLRQHRNLLLDTEPAPPFHAPQYLGNRVRHRSCAIANSSSKPASRTLTPPTARRPSPQGYRLPRPTYAFSGAVSARSGH